MWYNADMISKPKIQEDGSLYFMIEEGHATLECVVEVEDEQYVLSANDSRVCVIFGFSEADHAARKADQDEAFSMARKMQKMSEASVDAMTAIFAFSKAMEAGLTIEDLTEVIGLGVEGGHDMLLIQSLMLHSAIIRAKDEKGK